MNDKEKLKKKIKEITDWDKSNWVAGTIWTGKTDFDKGRRLQPNISHYKKGWFRGKEEFDVVKIRDIRQGTEDIHTFSKKQDAITFIKNYMKKHNVGI
jgi:hypothetical protein